MASRIRVPIVGGLNKSVVIDSGATVGSTIGVDLKGPTGQVLSVAGLAALLGVSSAPPAGPTGSIIWQRVLQIPPNIVALAALAGQGAVVRRADGSFLLQNFPVFQGADGDVGQDGDPGPPGAPGPTGPTGAAGIPGDDGAAGADADPVPGPTGAPGATGATGVTGAQGPQGPAGLPGDDGAPGADADSIPGQPGVQGPTGPTGATGATGAAGPTGPQGPVGLTGDDGEDGSDGDPVPGPIGPTGAAGAAGAAGATGPAGTAGPPGESQDGSEGDQGPPGRDSSSLFQQRGASWNGGGTSILLASNVQNVPVYIAQDCTIQDVTILTEGGTGSCSVDIWSLPVGSYPPTSANSIVGGNYPAITAGVAHYDSALTSWNTVIPKGNVLVFNLQSTSTFTEVNIFLTLKRANSDANDGYTDARAIAAVAAALANTGTVDFTYAGGSISASIDLTSLLTWTGIHTFTPSGATSPAVTINAAASQHGMVINGGNNVSANSYAFQTNSGAGTPGHQSGVAITGGTTSADVALLVRNAANVLTFLELSGDGSGTLGASATAGLQWSSAGAFNFGLGFLGNTVSSQLGYAVGAGGAVTQATSRTTGVTLNKIAGAITLFAAAGSATPATFTVTNSTVAATDVVEVCVKSGTNVYLAYVTAVAAGSFNITFNTTGGTTSDSPVINFAVIKAAAS